MGPSVAMSGTLGGLVRRIFRVKPLRIDLEQSRQDLLKRWRVEAHPFLRLTRSRDNWGCPTVSASHILPGQGPVPSS